MKYEELAKKYCEAVGDTWWDDEDKDPEITELERRQIAREAFKAVKGRDRDGKYECYGDCQACHVYTFAKWLDYRKGGE